MIKTIIWFVYFWAYLVAIIPRSNAVKKLISEGNFDKADKIVYETTRNWARRLVKLTGSNVNVRGSENLPREGSILFVSNHQGDFDIPILMGWLDRPKGFISKVEVKKLPMIRTWMKYMRCVFIDRKDARQSVEAINEGIKTLKEGHPLVIFPEGTRSRGDALGEFKPGSFKLATKSGVPVVPIVIKGSYRIFEENNYRMKGRNVEVVILPPVETNNLTKQEERELPSRVRRIIEEELNR